MPGFPLNWCIECVCCAMLANQKSTRLFGLYLLLYWVAEWAILVHYYHKYLMKRALDQEEWKEKEHHKQTIKRHQKNSHSTRNQRKKVNRLKSSTNTFIRLVNIGSIIGLVIKKMGQKLPCNHSDFFFYYFLCLTVSTTQPLNCIVIERRVEIMPLAYWH